RSKAKDLASPHCHLPSRVTLRGAKRLAPRRPRCRALPPAVKTPRRRGRWRFLMVEKDGRILVLVVDDYADASGLLAEALTVGGFDVLTANDGYSAVDLAGRHPAAAAFIDIGMPDLDGYEVARRLRALPNGKNLFLVALTGHSREIDRVRSADAGF